MKNIEKYLSLLDGEVDGLLLTSRYSRHYGAEFDIAEGVAIVAKAGCRYFTDTLGANLAGVKSILVKPIHNHNFWLKARHVLEQPFIFFARNRRIKL